MAGQAVVKIRDRQWHVNLATGYTELVRGLSNIPQIPWGTGMLFDLGYDTVFTITTDKMLFPIDIVRISSAMTVTDVVRDVQPGRLLTSAIPARYFLEVNAGETAGISPLDQASIQLTSAPRPQQVYIASLGAALLVMSLLMTMVKAL